MIQQLTAKGVNVPGGFATTAYAYRYFIKGAGLEDKLRKIFSDLDINDVPNLQKRGKQARTLILNTPFPQDLQDAITFAYKKMCQRYDTEPNFCDRFEGAEKEECLHHAHDVDVAVRSSATAEDLPEASFRDSKKPTLMFTVSKGF
jgi:pyruvate,water dikinase